MIFFMTLKKNSNPCKTRNQSISYLTLIYLILTSTPSKAATEKLDVSQLSYGPLLIAQQIESKQSKWLINLQYSADLNSPQYSLDGINLGVNYWITHQMYLGASLNSYKAKPLLLQQKLQDELKLNAVSIAYDHPQIGAYARFGFAPLHGIFSLFDRWVIQSSLIFGLGAGATKYSSGITCPAIQLSIEERLLIYRSIGLSLGLAHFLENQAPLVRARATDWAGRTQVYSGVYFEL